MNFLVSANIFETLGLGWEKILLYLINFVILFTGLTLLLYKPIKKFMAKREQETRDEVNAAEKIRAEAEELKKQGEEAAKNAAEEAKARISESEKEKEAALRESEILVAEARKEADRIITEAREAANEERKKAVAEARDDIAELSVEIAREILSREITLKDGDRLIDDCIKEWQDND